MRESGVYLSLMNVAYLYNRPPEDAEALEAEKVFMDYDGTARLERRQMMDAGGVRKGDTLILRATSDLGRGQEGQSLQRRLASMGVDIKVIPPAEPKRVRGRPKRLNPTDEQKEHLARLWYSAAPREHVLGRAKDIMGGVVSRDQMHRWCGPRDGSRSIL